MARTGRVFRLFVSSTFSDLKAERDALQERVFPRLRDLCEPMGARLQVIDLRWGVSGEASLDQQAMNICLGEIARCQQTTPRPNFLVLLGDRYGWRPLPYAIAAAEFELLLAHLTRPERSLACWRDDAPTELQGWYRRDNNAVPSQFVLRPRRKGGRFEEYEVWEREVERPLAAALERAALRAGLDEDALAKYTLSATGQEIVAGALRVPDACEHVFCFFRSIAGLLGAAAPAAGEFADVGPGTGTVDAEAHAKQERLKARLAAHVPANVHSYQAAWTGTGITTGHIDRLCEDVYTCLSRVILLEVEHPHEIAPAGERLPEVSQRKLPADPALDEEGLAHRRFAEERLRTFVGRAAILAQIAAHLRQGERRALAIVGQGGTGKSALIARAVQQAAADHPGAAVVCRFVGATPASSDPRSLLEGLCREISRHYGAATADVPLEYRDLVQELGKRMRLATAATPLFLFLDSLDQLSYGQGVRSLAWLPAELPENVRVVASTRPGDTLEALRSKLARLEEIGGLAPEEGDDLLSRWLAGAGRTLQPEQRRAVLDAFSRAEGNPLYLRLAFEEARHWTSEQPAGLLTPGVAGLIRETTMARLASEGEHGAVLVSHALGYLAASRYGLAEDELADLLSRDPEVYGHFMEGSYHVPPDVVRWAVRYRHSRVTGPAAQDGDGGAALGWLCEVRASPEARGEFLADVLPRPDGPRLPAVLWSRLSFDLAPYLAVRRVDGSALLTFYHRELGDAATAAYLEEGQATALHGRLAAYFRNKADPAGDCSWASRHAHALSELPYHLARAGLHDELYSTLSDFVFLERKAAEVGVEERRDDRGDAVRRYGGAQALREDFRLALEALGAQEGCAATGEASLVVTAADSGRGVQHSMDRRAAVLAAVSQALTREVHVLAENPDLLWQQLYNRLQWEGEAVTQVIAPELARRTTPGARPWLRLRTPYRESGALVQTLAGHAAGVLGCAFSPDGRLLASCSFDGTVRVWEAEQGETLHVLEGHAQEVDSCVFSPDGRLIVSAGWDRAVRTWDANTGQLLRTLRDAQNGTVTEVAFSPNGRMLLTVGGVADAPRLWDERSGVELRRLEGHTATVKTCAFSPDGRRLATAGEDKTVRLWDVRSGTELSKLQGHTRGVSACTFSPDGRVVASAGQDRTVRLWEVATGQLLRALEGHSNWVSSCCFSPDGLVLASACHDQTVRLWDVGSGRLLATLLGHTGRVRKCTFSPDGLALASSGDDATLRLWDLSAIRQEGDAAGAARTEAHSGAVAWCAFTPDGHDFVSAADSLRVWDASTMRSRRTLGAGAGVSGAFALSPDGLLLASAAQWGEVLVWDLAREEPVHTLRAHEKSVTGLAFSPDGRRLVSAGQDRVLCMWDVTTGGLLHKLRGHAAQVWACALSPDGRLIASASSDFTLGLWDAASAQRLHVLAGHRGKVGACSFSPDGHMLLSSGSDGTLRLWDSGSGRLLHVLEGHRLGATAFAFSPDGRTVVSCVGHGAHSLDGSDAALDHDVLTWDVATGRLRHRLEGHTSSVEGCAFSVDGRIVFSAGGSDRTLRAWDAESGEPLACLRLPGALRSLAIHPSAWVVGCGDWGGAVYLAEFIAWGSKQPTPTPYKTPATKVALPGSVVPPPQQGQSSRPKTHPPAPTPGDKSPEAAPKRPVGGGPLSTSSARPIAEPDEAPVRERPDRPAPVAVVRPAALPQPPPVAAPVPRALAGHSGAVTACAFAPDGRLVASAGYDKTLRLWAPGGGLPPKTLEGHRDGVLACAFSPDGRLLASAGMDGTLRLWDATDGAALRILEGHVRFVSACAFSPDGRVLASGGDDTTLRLWDVCSGKGLRTLRGHTDQVTACAFAPDGRTLLSASVDRAVRIWDVAGGGCLATLEGHNGWVFDCAFSPDGRFAASAGMDRTLRIWDTAGSEAVRTRRGHNYLRERRCMVGHGDLVMACAFSADGRFLASVSKDRTLRLWDHAKGVELACLQMPGELRSLALHPTGRQVVCGSESGQIFWMLLPGVEIGAVFVTAAEGERGPEVRCPACGECLPIGEEALGQEVVCAAPACGRRLRLNPFVMRPVDRKGSWLDRLRRK